MGWLLRPFWTQPASNFDMTDSPSPTTSTIDPVKLPGFGLPLNFAPSAPKTVRVNNAYGRLQDVSTPGLGEGGDLFPSVLNTQDLDNETAFQRLLTLREIKMMRIMCELTEIPMWQEKILDPTTAEQWKKEVLATPGLDFSENMMAWCINELRYKAALPIFKRFGAVSVYDGDVVKSDSLIPLDVKEALKEAVKSLENVPEGHRDWNPGTNGQVLNLVHPSLFPLVYGKSKILPDSVTTLEDAIRKCGEGIQVPIPTIDEPVTRGADPWSRLARKQDGFSQKFQWLPCDVDISGERARITSYVNNLHPQEHPQLYRVIEQILTRVIPLWNMTLTPLKTRDLRFKRISFIAPTFITPPPYPKALRRRDPGRAYAAPVPVLVQPEPEPFKPLFVPPKDRRESQNKSEDSELNPEQTVYLKRDFGHRGLQVIVKLTNIHLTPEKPSYPGGMWHVEGQLNEHICATAIYYYDNENITSSSLAFRQVANPNSVNRFNYHGRDFDWLETIFGMHPSGSSIQELGSVKTTEGRVITFPNILQHQIQPFQLADPTRPGHRKILAFFLVDPHIRIISTANVPCQRRDWWKEELREGGLAEFPVELQDKVVDLVEDFPIGLDEAKELRDQLMEERKNFVVQHQDALATGSRVSPLSLRLVD